MTYKKISKVLLKNVLTLRSLDLNVQKSLIHEVVFTYKIIVDQCF